MPELPEVETIAKQLNTRLRGRKIKSVTLLQSGRETPRGKKFTSALIGKTVKSISRRAKLLIWKFADGSSLLAHLKMTGRFVFVKKDYKPQKHDRAVFEFDKRGARSKEHLVWSDVRKFGFMKLFAHSYELDQVVDKYGPEPLKTSVKELAERLIRPKTRKIKVALMDQGTVAGIGNIYADEVLYRAHLRPLRRLASLTQADRLELARNIQTVLRQAIKKRGTSDNDYVDARGKKGEFQNFLRVYGRAGEKCRTCGTRIKRVAIGGRSAHYCPKCQL